MVLTRWLAAAFAVLLLLTGCSGDAEDATNDDSGSSPTTETSEPASEGNEADLPDGLQTVTAEQAGIRFGAPAGWQVAGADFLTNEGSQAELESLAERSGIPLEQLQQQVSQADVIVISPDGSGNINVLPLQGVTELPTQEALERDLGTVGATVSDVEEIDTELGPARVASYLLPTTGGEQFGASLFVVVDGMVINLTSTAGSAERASELTDQAAETLAAAD